MKIVKKKKNKILREIICNIMYLIYLNYRDYVCSNVYTEKKNQSRSRKVNEYNSSCVQKQCVCYTIIFFYNFDISTNACVNLPELWAMIIFACWITELFFFFFCTFDVYFDPALWMIIRKFKYRYNLKRIFLSLRHVRVFKYLI